jgi:8-oxo-dGTP diphosphatase
MHTIKRDTPRIRIAARGLIVDKSRLLFVSHDDIYWYLPGGKPEKGESLTQCVEREVYEETGLTVKTNQLHFVLECFDLNDQVHKLNFYFKTTVVQGQLLDTWNDIDGNVAYHRYFSLEEIRKNKTILPRFLGSGGWEEPDFSTGNVYQGMITMKGFEMVDV